MPRERDTAALHAQELIEIVRSLGFARVGVCDASPNEHADQLRDWLDQGRHGSMAYLERNHDIRTHPARLLQGARAFLVVADQYATRNDPPDPDTGANPNAPRGRVARYARGRDYHKVIKKRLHQLCDRALERFPTESFRAFVDTAPVPERELARRAAIGWTGKHTLTIHPRLGSFFLLGGVATTLELRPPQTQKPVTDHCGACARCIDACPTDAITPYSVDASRCVSYLTIERREPIDPAFFIPIGDWIFGCDICQEVCPHNSPRPPRRGVGRPHEAYAPERDGFDLLEVLGWTEEDRRDAFRASALKRATLPMMKRNALIALGNALRRRPDPQLRARVESIASDDAQNPLVRQTASDVLASLP
ncbi:MAG: tRNA epoxyqueuosine(34) reductase QueG [Phycisphaerales bacterium JB059]